MRAPAAVSALNLTRCHARSSYKVLLHYDDRIESEACSYSVLRISYVYVRLKEQRQTVFCQS